MVSTIITNPTATPEPKGGQTPDLSRGAMPPPTAPKSSEPDLTVGSHRVGDPIGRTPQPGDPLAEITKSNLTPDALKAMRNACADMTGADADKQAACDALPKQKPPRAR